MKRITIRRGMPNVQLTRAEFEKRFRDRFFDAAFGDVDDALQKIIEIAWDGYDEYRKNPRTRVGGKRFADPKAELPVEWLATRRAIETAERHQRNRKSKSRILLINGSSRSDQSCPGEISKTFRLVSIAKRIIERQRNFEVELLDLSRLTSEYGRQIHPCKACVSTAQPLCHWPCSCYPNFAMGQVSDWMSEIYPMWAAAHGVMIVCPVNWYQAPSSLKLMIDRLVCADGGNPDPTTTDGKDPRLAKQLELKGWDYPRHLSGRVFSVVVHGDASGTENLRRMLSDWLCDIGMIPAGRKALLDAYVGYYQPYATSHEELDADTDFQKEVGNAARALVEAVKLRRRDKLPQPDEGLRTVRPK